MVKRLRNDMKHRKRPFVTEVAMENRIKFLQMEEQNMFFLRHPYLTLEQSWGHNHALGKRKALVREMSIIRMTKTAKPNVTIEEQFNMLRNTDVWD
ncbi:large ribosomal subunit protein mL63 isoform X2 [Palaemon carinicauda]|uniref:large ribosomal subunit protein mL63 isoform X2 n=1 Tax=Palaemon carinicauda TaxID=392227 RepID=UPI0035B68CFB